MIMELGGDDLQDDLIVDESIAAEEEDESSPLIPGISQDSEESGDDRVALSNAAESALLLAKKRKRKEKDKERKAKVRSHGEVYFICSSSLKVEAEAGWNNHSRRVLNCISRTLRALELSRIYAS